MQNAPGSVNPAITAAVIAASVSFLAAIVSPVSAFWQRRAAHEKVQVDIQSLRWTQHAQAYPKLWSVIQRNTSDWRIEGKEVNAKWANDFVVQLNACHAECGVLFSQPVYARFCEFRAELLQIADQACPTKGDLLRLDLIWSGYVNKAAVADLGRPLDQEPGQVTLGLATLLKDELDSYQSVCWHQSA